MPESLGRLRRVRRVGAGGFASVWLYRDDTLDSLVAVKGVDPTEVSGGRLIG